MQITPQVLMNTLLQNVQAQYQRIGHLQEDIATGQRFQMPSDSPARVTATMNVTNALSQTQAYENTAVQAQNWLNTTNGAVQNMQQIVQNVLRLTVQASNSSLTPTDLQALSEQVTQAQKALGQLLNTRYQGVYIFAGYHAQTPVINNNLQWQGPKTMQAQPFQIGEASSVTVNLTGWEPVETNASPSSAPVNYFQKLYTDLGMLASQLRHQPTSQSLGIYIRKLQQDQGSLTTAQSIIGGRLERVSQTQSQLKSLALNLNQTIAHIAGTNMASITVQLTQEEQAYQAALQSGAQILPLSLLNFVHP